MRLNAYLVPAAMHDELANSDLARLLEGIADNAVALLGLVAIRDEVIGLLPIAASSRL